MARIPFLADFLHRSLARVRQHARLPLPKPYQDFEHIRAASALGQFKRTLAVVAPGLPAGSFHDQVFCDFVS